MKEMHDTLYMSTIHFTGIFYDFEAHEYKHQAHIMKSNIFKGSADEL